MQRNELVRGLGIWGAASVVVGTVIGSGVFLVASSMTQRVGTPGWVFFVWVFGGLLSLAGALTYAELGAMMPEAGGEYIYLREAYGPLWGFLYGWSQFLVMKTASLATLAAGFARYFSYFFPALHPKLTAVVIIAVLGFVNYFGVRSSGAVQTFFTFLKVALILALVAAALLIGGGSWSNFHTSIPIHSPMLGFVAALVAALWAYDGWNNLSMAGGEVANPQKNIPRSLILGTAFVGVLYILANVAYFYALPASAVAASKVVAADAARSFLGEWGGRFVAIAAMVSIFAALNGSILSGSRVPFAMARDGVFFSGLARVHPRFHSPHVAVVCQSVAGALMALTGQYEELFTYVIFASWIYYGLTAASVFVLRRKHPDWPRPYRTLGYPVLPALFVAVSGWLVVMTLAEQAWWRSLLGLGIISLGIPAYLFFRHKARKALITILLALLVLPAVARAGAGAGGDGSGELQFATARNGGQNGELKFAATNSAKDAATYAAAKSATYAATSAQKKRKKPAASTTPKTKSRNKDTRARSQDATGRREVLLFALNEAAALESLRAHGSHATAVSPQWFTLSADGGLSGAASPALLDACRGLKLPVIPAVTNRDFSADTAAALLGSRRARSKATQALIDKARRFSFAGYVIDFENLSAQPSQRKAFSAFLRDLQSAFRKPRLSLTVALPPPVGRARDAIDYKAAAAAADRVVLMAYDQHSRLGVPGPIAGYPWVESSIESALEFVPARKLLLGVAFYHRNWGELAATSGTYNDAIALQRQHKTELRWDDNDRAHWFGYTNDGRLHTVWMEDARSIAEKLALARRFKLAGIAGWRLGQEDPRVWLMLSQFRSAD